MNCKRGGFIIMRHNDIRDFEANLLKRVRNDVEIEPPLQLLTHENLERGAIILQGWMFEQEASEEGVNLPLSM